MLEKKLPVDFQEDELTNEYAPLYDEDGNLLSLDPMSEEDMGEYDDYAEPSDDMYYEKDELEYNKTERG